jgi:oxaloacetate decarboxylase gamma subunit
MSNFELGLLLMVVGMITVFAILLLVIGFGKWLIALINRYAPEEAPANKALRKAATAVGSSALQAETVAIVSAVSVLTGGKATSIVIND